MSSHKSTKKDVAKVAFNDPDSLLRFAETLKLRSLAASTQEEYLRYVRKLAARVKRDPAELDQAHLREHLLHLKNGQGGHGYSASSMRTASGVSGRRHGPSYGSIKTTSPSRGSGRTSH